MSALFLKLLNLSITSSWLIIAVIIVRFLLKKAPKWISCVLWALVAIRLIFPFSIESAMSLIPSGKTVPDNIEIMSQPAIDSGINVIDEAVNPVIAQSFSSNPGDSVNPLQIITAVSAVVWIVGVSALLLYALISYIKLKKNVAASILLKDNIKACDEVKSPFILGIFKPVIYVPSSVDGEALEYVITHEKTHIKRHDHWWKPLGYFLLTVYWFNPFCWISYILFCRDIELACDEKVIRKLNNTEKAAYSQALLNFSFPRRKIAVCPIAFGEVGVKRRVKSVLNYKKPAFWIIVVAVISCILVAVCFMTEPFSAKSLDERLKVSMDMAVAEHNHFEYAENGFSTCDYNVLRISKSNNKTIVYATVFDAEYVYDKLGLHSVSSSYTPAIITFDTSKGEDVASYDVAEYWTPRDGSYYTKDIFLKFPASLWLKVFSNKDVKQSEENCNVAAREYYGLHDDEKVDIYGNTTAKLEESDAKEAYLSFMAGNRSLLEEEQSKKWDIPDFSKDTFQYEYLICDLDKDALPELIVQMKNDPAGYNGVFHFENGKIFCWNSDAIEMSCRDYLLNDGTMVRQYDYNGNPSYTLFRYQSGGTTKEISNLFAYEQNVYGDASKTYPYYEIDGKEVSKTEFDRALNEMITSRLLERSMWSKISK